MIVLRHTAAIVIVLGTVGLVFGSFINALVWRLRQQDERDKTRIGSSKQHRDTLAPTNAKRHISNRDLSILRGRSMCPHCLHVLAPKDLVPVASWLSLSGKCRYCQAPISWQYPAIELFTAAGFVLSYLFWPYGFHLVGIGLFVTWLVFLVGCMALAVYDFRWYELPDAIVWPLVALAFAQTSVYALVTSDVMVLFMAGLAAGVIAGLFWLIYIVSKGRWIGFGDVKLGLVLGLLAGTPLRALLVIFFASCAGTLVSIPMLVRTKHKLSLRIPFGPFLIAGFVAVYFAGNAILAWYFRLLYL